MMGRLLFQSVLREDRLMYLLVDSRMLLPSMAGTVRAVAELVAGSPNLGLSQSLLLPELSVLTPMQKHPCRGSVLQRVVMRASSMESVETDGSETWPRSNESISLSGRSATVPW